MLRIMWSILSGACMCTILLTCVLVTPDDVSSVVLDPLLVSLSAPVPLLAVLPPEPLELLLPPLVEDEVPLPDDDEDVMPLSELCCSCRGLPAAEHRHAHHLVFPAGGGGASTLQACSRCAQKHGIFVAASTTGW